MRHGHFAVLVAALFGVRHLIFDLNATCTGFDHFLRQQICRFFITETGINIGNNRHNMGFEIIDRRQRCINIAAIGARFVQIDEQMPQFARIGLLQKCVDFLNQGRHGGFFVHGLVG